MEFSHVFAHVAWQFHAVFNVQSHGVSVSMKNFIVSFSHGIPWGYKTGTAILQDRLPTE